MSTLLARGKGLLTLEDVLATLNSKELKKRMDVMKESGDGLYVRGRADWRDKHQSGNNSRYESRGRT